MFDVIASHVSAGRSLQQKEACLERASRWHHHGKIQTLFTVCERHTGVAAPPSIIDLLIYLNPNRLWDDPHALKRWESVLELLKEKKKKSCSYSFVFFKSPPPPATPTRGDNPSSVGVLAQIKLCVWNSCAGNKHSIQSPGASICVSVYFFFCGARSLTHTVTMMMMMNSRSCWLMKMRKDVAES